ncbi:hypothetical protein R6Q59_013026 [Mikania micrantha]|uniref:Uncharacterized protein n=1 Tax=Mikania micrantha TaxID=192012 RepID=A0A5N6LP67_9ASTR|nr:hypothetical protein E3N88_41000 [Mikania micrantha]
MTTATTNTTGQLPTKPTTTLRCESNHRRLWRLRAKKKLPTVRLGGQKQGERSGSTMMKLIRRIRIRWLKLKKARVLKKLKEYYLCVLKDLTENDRSLEKHQQLLLMETSFAVPVMGIPINSFR